MHISNIYTHNSMNTINSAGLSNVQDEQLKCTKQNIHSGQTPHQISSIHQVPDEHNHTEKRNHISTQSPNKAMGAELTPKTINHRVTVKMWSFVPIFGNTTRFLF